MGKKSKVGKNRQDDYYHMAKSTGLRARSAFKLIQMNKKYHILEKSKILIDLCAAPGGWMQVASRTMKSSSVIIGIDLDPIKPIKGAVSIVADITKDECRQLIKQQIKDAKADVILHDGAPNVGANWSVDGFAQAHLCLKAFALATSFLVKNGTFITKVFRSKDYDSLKWVLEQLFEKVHVEKPSSSRLESAEIFLVCLKYKAPNTIDPKFLDIDHVFENVEEEDTKALTFNRMLKMKKKADGYEEGDSLYKVVKFSELVLEKVPMNIVLTCNKIVIDDEATLNHPLTTEEIKQYVMDLKLLSKFAFKTVEKWLKKITPIYKKNNGLEQEKKEVVIVEEKTEEQKIDDDILRCETELKKTEKKKLKSQRKEKMKQIKMIQMNMLHPGDIIEQTDDIDMFSASKNQHLIDQGIIETDVDVSSLDKIIVPMDDKRKSLAKKIRKTKEMFTKESDKYYDNDEEMIEFLDPEDKDSDDEFIEEDEIEVDLGDDFGSDDLESDDDEISVNGMEEDSLEEEENRETKLDVEEDIVEDDEKSSDIEEDNENSVGIAEDNPDIVEDKDINMEDVDEEDIEDIEEDSEEIEEDSEEIEEDSEDNEEDNEEDIEEIEEDSGSDDEKDSEEESGSGDEKDIKKFNKSEITDLNFDPSATTPKAKRIKRTDAWFNSESFSKLMDDDNADEESNSDNEIVEDIIDDDKKVKNAPKPKPNVKNDTEITTDETKADHAAIMNTLKRKLTPKERAIAYELIKSKKSRREIFEWGYNRYQFEDEKLPRWLVEDELKHMKPDMSFLHPDAIKDQKALVSTNINKRTIKRVEQAKARKKNRVMRKLHRINKNAEKLDEDMSLVEKSKKLKELNKRVSKIKNTKKSVVTEVTNKSGARGRAGKFIKGAKVKVVDRRMKSDSRTRGASKSKKGGRK